MLKRNNNKPNNQNINQKSLIKNYKLTSSLDKNIKLMKEIFREDDTLIIRNFENQYNHDIRCCILFIDGMVNDEIVNENIIRPIMVSPFTNYKNKVDDIIKHVIVTNNVDITTDVNKMINSIIGGDTILLLDGASEAISIRTIGWKFRAIEEPEGEKAIRGPREGFTESLMVNISMVRRKLLTSDLKFKYRVIGRQSHTRICICYIEGIANKKILKELENRLDSIDIDGVLEVSYIQEVIRDSPLSLFKTVGSTERPDVVASKILDGRIAILVDGTPVAATLPFIFLEYFQSNEDYYLNFYFASIGRLLRIFSFLLSMSLSAGFVALTAFHQEMIPTQLLISISAARQGVPFPIALELLVLLVTFEILREAGTRMPTNIGQALSIVGALVLGQSAVEARFVSAPVVIIVALSAITGLATPKIKGTTIILRFVFLLLSSIIGLYGYLFGMIGMLIHLFDLRSFGVPYMLGLMNLNTEDLNDTAIRVPWIYMKYRPKFISFNNLIRSSTVESGDKKT